VIVRTVIVERIAADMHSVVMYSSQLPRTFFYSEGPEFFSQSVYSYFDRCFSSVLG